MIPTDTPPRPASGCSTRDHGTAIVWLASPRAGSDERLVAAEFEQWLAAR